MPNLLDCARVHATEGEIVESPAAGLRHLHRDPRLLAAGEGPHAQAVRRRRSSSPARHRSPAGARRRRVGQGRRRLLRPRQAACPTVTVAKGTKVTWRFPGKTPHNVTVTRGPGEVRLRRPRPAGTFTQEAAPSAAPTRSYCTIHSPPTMRMKLARQALALARRPPMAAARLQPQDPRRRRQARPRRARPRREDHRPRAARRRHGGHLHRPAPDARADRRDRACRRTPTPSGSRSSPART